MSLTCDLFGWVKVWLITVNHGYACYLKQLSEEGHKKGNITARREESLDRSPECPTPGLWKKQGWDSGHSRALGQCQISRDFILTPLFFLVELLWAQTADFHTALNL